MAKEKSSNGKRIISIILIALIGTILILSIPIILAVILSLLFPNADGYLLTGFSFSIFGIVAIMLIPIILFMLISKKNNRKNDIKKLFNNYKIFSIVIILLILLLEFAFGNRVYTYFKDIKEGPQETIMTDAYVEVKSSYRSRTSYIVGYIDGKEIHLELTRDAHSSVSKNKKYKMIKIKYYKNIQEVYDINYVDDK